MASLAYNCALKLSTLGSSPLHFPKKQFHSFTNCGFSAYSIFVASFVFLSTNCFKNMMMDWLTFLRKMLCILTVHCHAELILMHCYDLPIVMVDFHFFVLIKSLRLFWPWKICGLIKWEKRGSNATSESVIVICKSRVHDAEIINMSIIIAW